MKLWKKALLVVLILALAGGGYAIWHQVKSPAEPTPVSGQVVEVQRGSLIKTVSASGNLDLPHQVRLTFGVGGVVSEVKVDLGDVVKKGQVLAKLETDSFERAVARAKASLRTAQINLEKLEELYTPADRAQAEAAVQSAEANLAAAKEDLEEAQNPYSEDDLAAAEARVRDKRVALENAQRNLTVAQKNSELAVQKAQDDLDNAQKAYEDYVKVHIGHLTNPDIAERKDKLWEKVLQAQDNLEIAQLQREISMATAENNVSQAEVALAQAEQDLADMKEGADPVKVQKAQAQVATAQASLDKAREQLEDIKSGPDPLDLELKQIQVQNAQLSLDEAEEQLEEATLKAPFDGVVAEVKIKAGDRVSGGTLVARLVDTSRIEVDATVDEIDVAQLRPGQRALITLDALPEARLRGKLVAISPVATIQAGVVTYAIRLEVQASSELGLREGMTCLANIVVEHKQNVLLVPNRAIKTVNGKKVVEVVLPNGKIEERPVDLGSSNSQYTEVLQGLKEGEKVLLRTTSKSTRSSVRPGMIMPGIAPRPPHR